jgi:hypothetical protein
VNELRERTFNRFFAISMIAVLLLWNVMPYMAMAGTFITPGEAMKPGETFKPGKPIDGGQFIIPGKVYDPGNPIKPGEAAGASGTPIIPQGPNSLGLFIIPNVPPPPPGSFYWEFIGLEGGSPLKGGSPLQGGDASKGGDGLKGGDPSKGGDSLKGGDPSKGGDGLKGGDPSEGGDGLKGGDPTKGGDGIEGGDPTKGGDSNIGGKNPDGGKAPNGGEDYPTTLESIIKTTDNERGWFSHLTGFIDDYKTYGLGFILDKNVVGGAVSMLAGFEFEQAANGKGYNVKGKKDVKYLNKLYQHYKSYVMNGNDRSLGTHTKYIKEKTYNLFRENKGLMHVNGNPYQHTWNNLKTHMSESWQPFSKKVFSKDLFKWSSWKNGSLINKSFFSSSAVSKLNGPLNYIMASAGSIYDYGWGSKQEKGFFSSDFFADVSTEVAIGATTTALGSIASSAFTGALAGSAVPGFGTVAGAVAGLAVGITISLGINRTDIGRSIKQGINSGFKYVYSGIGKGIKGIGSGIGKLGGLFGG